MRLVLILAMALAACTPRGTLTFDSAAAQVGDVEEIFLATTRKPDPATGGFLNERSETMTFASFSVSVPPDRELGQITWPREGQPADPATEFVTVGRAIYETDADFRSRLARAIRNEDGEVTIFVHGYNNNFAEGLYRVAQLSSDLDLPGLTVHYAWPSRARAFGYVADRDSALISRKGLVALIEEVERAGARRVVLLAHSMGAQLMMESLMQISLAGRRDVMDRIGGIVLISPDIDVEVFRSQARSIGNLPQPFIIFTSATDPVLRLSARLTGQRDRLGTLTDLSRVEDLEVTVVDSTAFATGSGHFNAAESPALIRILDRMADVEQAFGRDAAGRPGLLPGAVLTVQNATQIILSPVAAIGEGDF